MGDNNEQEAADLDAMNDGDNLFEITYLGGNLHNIYDDEDDGDLLLHNPRPPIDYTIPNVPFRLIIHASITVIDISACCHFRMLTEVVFHDKVTRIGSCSFQSCTNLQRIELPEGLLRIEDGAFCSCHSLREITIPAGVQFIGDRAFGWCESLERLVFTPTPNMIEFGRAIFVDCSNLRFVTLPQNLQSIPDVFFRGCILLENIQIPVSVEEIGESAFCGTGVRSFEISRYVHRIGVGAWRDCSFLERVTFHSSNNLVMDRNIFVNCPLLSVVIIYPWMWPKLFVSMEDHPNFILKFFRQYQNQIFDFETPVVRPLQRLRRR